MSDGYGGHTPPHGWYLLEKSRSPNTHRVLAVVHFHSLLYRMSGTLREHYKRQQEKNNTNPVTV